MLLLITLGVVGCSCGCSDAVREATFTGKVLDKFRTNGQNRDSGEDFIMIFRDDESNKIIKLKVNTTTYYTKNVGDIVSFTLDAWTLTSNDMRGEEAEALILQKNSKQTKIIIKQNSE